MLPRHALNTNRGLLPLSFYSACSARRRRRSRSTADRCDFVWHAVSVGNKCAALCEALRAAELAFLVADVHVETRWLVHDRSHQHTADAQPRLSVSPDPLCLSITPLGPSMVDTQITFA